MRRITGLQHDNTPDIGCQACRYFYFFNCLLDRVHTTSSFTDKGLTAGKTYYYKVRAYVTPSSKRIYSKFTTAVKGKPVPKTLALKAKAGKKKVILSWKKVPGADQYQVYRAKAKTGKYIKLRVLSKTKYTDKKLKKGKTYYYKARAAKKVKGKNLYGKFSDIKKIKVK